MKSIRITNLRGLKDTGEIRLAPITLLVGANSSGKSSFLRTFPLFKQSSNVYKRGPILWYDSEVDFGSFKEAVRRDETSMTFSFSWDSIPYTFWQPLANQNSLNNVTCKLVITGDSEEAAVSELHISIGEDQNIKIEFKQDDAYVFVNNRAHIDCSFKAIIEEAGKSFLPVVNMLYTDSKSPIYLGLPTELVKTTLGNIPKLKKKVSSDGWGYWIPVVGSKLDVLGDLKSKFRLKTVDGIDSDPNWLLFNDMSIMLNLKHILLAVDKMMQNEFLQVLYIKPFRASAERYYRKQNVAVNTLESDGHNMAMFVNNMYKNKTEASKFKKWTKKFFDFELEAERSEGHVSLTIKDGNNQDFRNIADKGFGYSQILPFILTLWQIYAYSSKNNKKFTTFAVIEQPELHLHPRMQAQVMDAIVAVVQEAIKYEVDVKFIIETHSEVMINRLGLRIAEKLFDQSHSSILLFGENEGQNPKVASFDNDGFLINWPTGFFNPLFKDVPENN